MDTQTLLTFAEATKTLPRVNGKRIHVSTLYRWYSTGVKGVKLRCAGCGRRLLVSREALQEFMVAVAAVGPVRRVRRTTPSTPPKGRTPQQRERDIEKAEAYLKSQGAM